MKRRTLLVAGALFAAIPWHASAQRQTARPKIGLLWIEAGDESIALSAFMEGLREHGYSEGKNIEIRRSFVDRYDRLPEAARLLVNAKVDAIVTYGTTATLAARKATSTVPIVMIMGGDPVKAGIVASLSQPGGNVTGVTFVSRDLLGKRLEILKETVPGIRRVGVLFNPASATESTSIDFWEVAGRRLKVDIQPVEIRLAEDIDRVIGALPQQKLDALAVTTGTMFIANRNQIVAAIAKTRLPALYGSADDVDAGGLISYGADRADGFRRAAGYVTRILAGAKPADMAVEQPTKFELAVNLRTVRALGITIPSSILLRADKVIE